MVKKDLRSVIIIGQYFLIHSGDTSSTRINIWSNLEDNDLTGILDWTKHDYTVGNPAITFWDFPAQDGLTA